MPLLVCSLFMLSFKNVGYQPPVLIATSLRAMMDSYPLEPLKQILLFKLPWSGQVITATEKLLTQVFIG